jgi:hypothetical protein
MQEQDVLASAPICQIKMTGEEKARISTAISALRMERVALAKKLEKSKAEEVNALRAKRRNIQISRTRSSEEDSSLGQNLFSSLLAEANAEAGVGSALSDFDHNNAVEIQFAAHADGSREVSAIKLGSRVVWTETLDNSVVASR